MKRRTQGQRGRKGTKKAVKLFGGTKRGKRTVSQRGNNNNNENQINLNVAANRKERDNADYEFLHDDGTQKFAENEQKLKNEGYVRIKFSERRGYHDAKLLEKIKSTLLKEAVLKRAAETSRLPEDISKEEEEELARGIQGNVQKKYNTIKQNPVAYVRRPTNNRKSKKSKKSNTNVNMAPKGDGNFMSEEQWYAEQEKMRDDTSLMSKGERKVFNITKGVERFSMGTPSSAAAAAATVEEVSKNTLQPSSNLAGLTLSNFRKTISVSELGRALPSSTRSAAATSNTSAVHNNNQNSNYEGNNIFQQFEENEYNSNK
jgi:hypothetical protein